ncbi:hypothetical protein C7S16_2870 [Burkholderia thailandensis]|uniref:Uncharacterized protein n=1 Tax=Burkholderia thailandensis TaxID=57975 RepID=A0AAW9D3Q1_BURTH|nr:hypothetical protein [Burkholderia thailandensis]MDW9256427.1 hypothetical protein [Burkholderia thailandensis]
MGGRHAVSPFVRHPYRSHFNDTIHNNQAGRATQAASPPYR